MNIGIRQRVDFTNNKYTVYFGEKSTECRLKIKHKSSKVDWILQGQQ